MSRRLVIASLVLVLLAVAVPSASAAEPLATCFWEGPISMKRPTSRGFDGHFFNFPEKSATYWLARFRIPSGGTLRLKGRYAHARYQSLNAYSDGAPTDALSDLQTIPDPGSTNPFVAGARRDLPRRSYTATVLDQPPPPPGAPRQANAIYGGSEGDAPIELFLRTYEPDRGLDLDGGAGLPEPELVSPDGSTTRGQALCGQVNDPDRSIPVQTIPAALWQAGRNAPGCDGRTNPAYDPVRWERFLTIDYAQQAVVLDCTPQGRATRLADPPAEKGGFYSNRDNAYIYAHLSRRFGRVLTVNAKLPVTPHTYAGQRRMEGGQLRFWSLCTGESRVTLRTPDCVSDRELPLDGERRFTVVVSRAADRPANATAPCGVAWVDWGERGDGAGDPDYAVLIMRNMLPHATFAQAIQRVMRPGTEPDVMGDYFPSTSYGSTDGFQRRGCRRSSLVLRGKRIRVSRRRRVRIRMQCTSREALCTGRLRLSAGRRRVGRARFSVESGHSRVVAVRLSRRGRARARRARRIKVTATGATPVGVPLSARRSYRVRR